MQLQAVADSGSSFSCQRADPQWHEPSSMCVLQQEEDRQDSRLSGLQAVRGTSARPLERQVGLARWRLESKAPGQVIEWNEYMLAERGSIPEAAEPSHHVGWFLNS